MDLSLRVEEINVGWWCGRGQEDARLFESFPRGAEGRRGVSRGEDTAREYVGVGEGEVICAVDEEELVAACKDNEGCCRAHDRSRLLGCCRGHIAENGGDSIRSGGGSGGCGGGGAWFCDGRNSNVASPKDEEHWLVAHRGI